MAELEVAIAQETAALALDVRAELIRSMRVDTGWARANNQIVVGGPATQTLGTPGTASGFSEAVAVRTALTYRTEMGPLYLSNRVPYVGLRGTRRGALTVTEAEAAIRRAIAGRAAELSTLGDAG